MSYSWWASETVDERLMRTFIKLGLIEGIRWYYDVNHMRDFMVVMPIERTR